MDLIKKEGLGKRRTEKPQDVDFDIKVPEIYGDCDINSEWKTIEDLDKNIARLPKRVRDLILKGQTDRATSTTYSPEAQLTELLRKLLFEKTAEERAVEIVKRGKKEAIDFLVSQIFYHLENQQFFQQQKERIRRGVDEATLKKEVGDFISQLWDKSEAPWMNSSKLSKLAGGFREEIDRLNREIKERKDVIYEIRKQRHATKLKGQRRKLDERLERFTKIYGEPLFDTFRSKGYLRDLELQLFHNQEEVEKIKRRVESAELIEQVFERVKPKLNPSDMADIWIRVFSGTRDLILESVALDAILDWYTEHSEISELEQQLDYSEKIDLLIRKFGDVFVYLHQEKREGESAAASVQHAQIILRKLLDFINKQNKLKAVK